MYPACVHEEETHGNASSLPVVGSMSLLTPIGSMTDLEQEMGVLVSRAEKGKEGGVRYS